MSINKYNLNINSTINSNNDSINKSINNSINNSINDSINNIEYDISNDIKILGECIKSKKKSIKQCKIFNYEIYNCINVFDFVENIKSYTFNNELNEPHILDIYNKINKSNAHFIDGVFSVIYCNETNKLYLIDGHHRLEALKEMMTTSCTKTCNKLNQFDITIHLYETDNVDSQNTLNLYHRLNNLKPYDINKNNDKTRQLVVSRIIDYYPSCFKVKKTRSIQKPFLDKLEFSKSLINKIKNNPTIDYEVLFSDIVKINNNLKNKKISELYYEYDNSSNTEKKKINGYYNKAIANKFYLGTPLGINELKNYMNV